MSLDDQLTKEKVESIAKKFVIERWEDYGKGDEKRLEDAEEKFSKLKSDLQNADPEKQYEMTELLKDYNEMIRDANFNKFVSFLYEPDLKKDARWKSDSELKEEYSEGEVKFGPVLFHRTDVPEYKERIELYNKEVEKFYKKRIRQAALKDSYIRGGAISALLVQEQNFAKAYLNSRYALNAEDHIKEENELISEMNHLASFFSIDDLFPEGYGDDGGILFLNRCNQVSNTYADIIKIIKFEEARSLDEITECSNMIVPNHSIIKKLGSGASGTTYLTYSEEQNKKFAIKIIHNKEPNAREAEILARIDNDNIVKVHYAGHFVKDKKTQARYGWYGGDENFIQHLIVYKEIYGIMMDYVEGETLRQILEKRSLSHDEALIYSAQILNGICGLREHGLFHRDLRPENIMVDSKNIIKIIDFGLSTERREFDNKSNRRYGGPTDFFSLGLITYKMITGEHLVLSRAEEMTTQSYANRIFELKQQFYDEKNQIRSLYQQRINNNVPSGLRDIITISLKSDDLEQIKHEYCKIKDDLKYYLMKKPDLIKKIIELEMKR